jgi:hypothetical protein
MENKDQDECHVLKCFRCCRRRRCFCVHCKISTTYASVAPVFLSVEVALQMVKYPMGVVCGGVLSPANRQVREGPRRTGADPQLRLSTPPSPQRAEIRRRPDEGGMHAHEGKYAALLPHFQRVFSPGQTRSRLFVTRFNCCQASRFVTPVMKSCTYKIETSAGAHAVGIIQVWQKPVLFDKFKINESFTQDRLMTTAISDTSPATIASRADASADSARK